MKQQRQPRQKPTAQRLEEELGQRIRTLRLERRVSLEAVAQRAGITRGFLSKIERGEKAPAISSLINIANAMDIRVGDLLEPEGTGDRVSVIRSGEQKAVVRTGTSFGYKYVSLAHKLTKKHMEPFLVLLPTTLKGAGTFQHAGEEFIFVLKGKVLIRVGKQDYVLGPGDALYFDSSIPHWGRSLNRKGNLVLSVSYVR